ncbi:hypothetical protein ACGFS9_17100 [Streptomyces sp. NPDC048566]|uniref:hypothetical protein n=1 Tax=Streptomyces sp. NPDC048566 TaxID=3365569 RepID=UPI00371D4DF1
MRRPRRAARGAVLLCVLVSAVAGCGETNNIHQQAGRDGKVCVNAACPEEPEQPGPSASSAASPSAPESPRESSGDHTTDRETAAGPDPGGDAEEPTAAPRPDVRVRYLTDDGPIGGYGNNERSDVAVLGDGPHPKSVVFSPGVFGKEVKPLSFTVPTGLTGFRAKVGLDKDTLPDYVALVAITRRDGSTVTSLTLHGGEVHDVTEDVSDAGLITIDVSIVTWASDAINSRPHVVVGDGRFVT